MDNNKSKSIIKRPHSITLSNRKHLVADGVFAIGKFDQDIITAFTDIGMLVITGKNLHIKKLSIESGDLEIEGEIKGINYTEKKLKDKNFLKFFSNRKGA